MSGKLSVDEKLVQAALAKATETNKPAVSEYLEQYKEVALKHNCGHGGWEEQFAAMSRRLRTFVGMEGA